MEYSNEITIDFPLITDASDWTRTFKSVFEIFFFNMSHDFMLIIYSIARLDIKRKCDRESYLLILII